MRSLNQVLLLGIVLAVPAHAQGVDARIDAATQRWQAYQERLQSTDPVIRSEALGVALRDENDAIRNGALWYAMRSRQTLPINLVIPPGSSLDPGSVPILDVTDIEWNRDGRGLRGRNRSHRQSGVVRGELVEGKLRLIYAPLGMAPDFGTSDDTGAGRRPRVQRRQCSVILSFEPSRNALEGPLQCEGMSQTFAARLPLG